MLRTSKVFRNIMFGDVSYLCSGSSIVEFMFATDFMVVQLG